MKRSYFLSFFDNIKNFKKQLDKIETSVYSGKQSLLEVYELNARLEKEIDAKTQELEVANKQMLTLQLVKTWVSFMLKRQQKSSLD